MEHHCEHDNDSKRNKYDGKRNGDYDGVQCDYKFHHDLGIDDYRTKRDGYAYRGEIEHDRPHDGDAVDD